MLRVVNQMSNSTLGIAVVRQEPTGDADGFLERRRIMRVPGRPRHLLLSWNGTRNSRFIAQGLLRPAEHLAGSHPAAPLAHLFPHEWFRTFGLGALAGSIPW